jgi:hypothetical protein
VKDFYYVSIFYSLSNILTEYNPFNEEIKQRCKISLEEIYSSIKKGILLYVKELRNYGKIYYDFSSKVCREIGILIH